jgi:uncharacterized protein (TIGR02118 family)
VLVVLGFLKRKPGLSLEEFFRYWRDVHGPLVRGTPEVARHFRKYVQHQLTPNTGSPGAPPLPYDAFSETWFDSMEDRNRMRAEPKYREMIGPDEANFLDSVRLSMFDDQVVQIGPT